MYSIRFGTKLYSQFMSILMGTNYASLVIDLPASVAQLAVRPTGDQQVASSTPAGSATFFRGDWS